MGAFIRTSFAAGVVSAGLVVGAVPSAWAATSVSGALDPTFGGDGTVVTDVTGDGKSDTITDVTVTPDGKIIAVGYSVVRALVGEEEDQPDHDFVVVRYNVDGSLDTTFGVGGVVLTGMGGSQSRDEAEAVALQADGKIVVAGDSDLDLEALSDLVVVRYNVDGSLDTTFGTGGKAVVDVDGGESVAALAIQANGRIVIAGSAYPSGSDSGNYDFMLVQLLATGAVDTSFGVGGTVMTGIDATGIDAAGSLDIARAMAVQPDGRIVVAGSSNADGTTRYAAARYHADGSLDTTFGTGGIVVTAVNNGVPFAVAVQNNGKVVLAGSGAGITVVRYRRDGTVDTAFGTDGTATTPLNARADAVAIQRDGAIVVAGVYWPAMGGMDHDFAVARFDRTGALDTTFGAGGTVTTDLSGGGSFDDANAVAIQRDGGIVVAGSSNARVSSDLDFAIARYQP